MEILTKRHRLNKFCNLISIEFKSYPLEERTLKLQRGTAKKVSKHLLENVWTIRKFPDQMDNRWKQVCAHVTPTNAILHLSVLKCHCSGCC